MFAWPKKEKHAAAKKNGNEKDSAQSFLG